MSFSLLETGIKETGSSSLSGRGYLLEGDDKEGKTNIHHRAFWRVKTWESGFLCHAHLKARGQGELMWEMLMYRLLSNSGVGPILKFPSNFFPEEDTRSVALKTKKIK